MKLTKSGWFRKGSRWGKRDDCTDWHQQALRGTGLVLVENDDWTRDIYVDGSTVTIAELEDAIAFKRAEKK